MVIGAVQIWFRLHECQTLKDKRSVVRQVIDRTRGRFKVSIAEVGALNDCKAGEIGFAVVSNDKRQANSLMDQIIDSIEAMNLLDVTDIQTEFL